MSPRIAPEQEFEPHRVDKLEMKLKQSAAAATQLKGWVYWQRDPHRLPNCWTKVFAVLDNAFLWLFQREESAPESLLVQIAVASVEGESGRLLHLKDSSGEGLCICFCDDVAFARWKLRLNDAAHLTSAFFRTSRLGVQDLPRWSNYRGTLEDYNRVSRRTRCRDAVTKIARRWRTYQQYKRGVKKTV